jgi:HlyD family secretion protein
MLSSLFAFLKRYWLLSSLVVGGLLLGSGLYVLNLPPEVAVMPLRPTNTDLWLALSGRVVADRQVAVSSPTGGTLLNLLVEEGQTVSKGQLLAELDARSWVANLAEARARQSQAQAQLTQTQQGERPEKRLETQAKLQEAEQQLASVNRQWEASEAVATQAQQKKERFAPLYTQKTISPLEWEAVQAEAKQSAAKAQAMAEDALAYRQRLEQVKSLVAQVKNGARSTEVAAASAAVAAESARSQSLSATGAHYFLKAPFAGLVTQRNHSAGDVLSAGQAVLSLLDPFHLQLEADLEEEDLVQLPPVPQAIAVLEAYPNLPIVAKWERLQPQVESGSGLLRLRLGFPVLPPSVRLFTGLSADVFVKSHHLQQAWLVPKAAVLNTQQGDTYVLLADASGHLQKLMTPVKSLSRQLVQLLDPPAKGTSWQVVLEPKAELLDRGVIRLKPSKHNLLEDLAQPPLPNAAKANRPMGT